MLKKILILILSGSFSIFAMTSEKEQSDQAIEKIRDIINADYFLGTHLTMAIQNFKKQSVENKQFVENDENSSKIISFLERKCTKTNFIDLKIGLLIAIGTEKAAEILVDLIRHSQEFYNETYSTFIAYICFLICAYQESERDNTKIEEIKKDIKFLLSANIDIDRYLENQKSMINGLNALKLALIGSDTEVAHFLLDCGASVLCAYKGVGIAPYFKLLSRVAMDIHVTNISTETNTVTKSEMEAKWDASFLELAAKRLNLLSAMKQKLPLGALALNG